MKINCTCLLHIKDRKCDVYFAKDYLIPCFLWSLKFYKQKTMNYYMTIEILKVEAVWFGWLFIYLIFIFFLWNLRHVPLRDSAIYWCRCWCRLACVQTSDVIPEGGETSVHWIEVDVHIKKRQSTSVCTTSYSYR